MHRIYTLDGSFQKKTFLNSTPLVQAGPAARVAAPSAVSGSTATVSGSGSSDAAAQQALVLAEGRRQLPLDLKQLLKLQRLGP